jgi:ATP-binding cassette subfamily F protein 3
MQPAEGEMQAPGKLKVGYFTQYQVEELAGDATPVELMTRAMEGKTPAAVRAQLGRFGFSGPLATSKVEKLSGGERARLALAIITRDAPHMLILDEPTNHLDVDAREALIQALNDFSGAVLLISHDRHMVELTADRLVLVDGGTARDYAGSMDDYIDFVLGRNQPRPPAAAAKPAAAKASSAQTKAKARYIKSELASAEKGLAKLEARLRSIDQAMYEPANASADIAQLTMTELLALRAKVAEDMAKLEADWLALGEQLEALESA